MAHRRAGPHGRWHAHPHGCDVEPHQATRPLRPAWMHWSGASSVPERSHAQGAARDVVGDRGSGGCRRGMVRGAHGAPPSSPLRERLMTTFVSRAESLSPARRRSQLPAGCRGPALPDPAGGATVRVRERWMRLPSSSLPIWGTPRSGPTPRPDGRSRGHRFVHSNRRPAVQAFFDRWGWRVAILSRVEVRSDPRSVPADT